MSSAPLDATAPTPAATTPDDMETNDDAERSPWAALLVDELNTKKESMSDEFAFSDETEKRGLIAVIDAADKPAQTPNVTAAAFSVMQICTTAKAGKYTSCMFWPGGFPRFARSANATGACGNSITQPSCPSPRAEPRAREPRPARTDRERIAWDLLDTARAQKTVF